MAERDPTLTKLPNAPLQEVMFEVRWPLEISANNLQYDEGFELAQGVFTEKAKEYNFKGYKRLIPQGIPLNIPNRPIHQFWKQDNIWPIIQLGPGVMTVNDTEKNYEWEKTFYPLIKEALDILSVSYGGKDLFDQVILRYIDVVDLSENDFSGLRKFLDKNLKTKFYRGFSIEGRLTELNLNEVYNLSDDSKLHLNISTGVRNKTNTPVLIWQTTVLKKAPILLSEIKSWITNAHQITSDLFVEMLDQSFYDSFKAKN